MTVKQIKQIIRKQAAINKVATEYYENEACEIIVYDAINDYCIEHQFRVWHFIEIDNNEYKDEPWRRIARLYADILAEEGNFITDHTVVEILNYYHDKFWV